MKRFFSHFSPLRSPLRSTRSRRAPPGLRRATLLRCGLSVALGAAAAGAVAADTDRYIRDWIAVPLLANSAPDSKTVHAGLTSGTAVTVLETNEATGYSRVRTREGAVGWLATRYLSDEPSARFQLEQANAELQELRALKTQLAALPTDLRTASQQLIDARTENSRLQQELADSRRTPSEAAEISAENNRLRSTNEDLQQQLSNRDIELQTLRGDTSQRQFRDGGLAVVAGMLLIAIVRRLWPKKRSEWS